MKTAAHYFLLCLLLPTYTLNAQDNPEEFYYNEQQEDCSCDQCNKDGHFYGWQYKPMSNRDFSELKSLIGDRWFESMKMEFAKSAVDVNYFSTRQVKELLELVSFESSKVELAKYIYSRTVDKRNYFKLYDVFYFQSSIKEIHDFISIK